MKPRSTNLNQVAQHEEYRLLKHSNQGGDEYTPVLITSQEEANTEELAQLAEELRLCHESFQTQESLFHAALKMSVGEGIKCGMILLEVKRIVGYSNFMDWVKANAPFSQKSAQRYIQLAKNKESVTILNATSLTDCYVALGLLKKPVADTDNNTTSQTRVNASLDDDSEDLENETEANDDLFKKAKDLSDRLAQLVIQTDDQEGMVEAVQSIVAWYEGYLAMKKAEQQKAEKDAEFDKQTSTTA